MPAAQAIRFIRDESGARVAYAVVGEGPLILCPAWWVSHLERDWEHPGFRRFFGRLADGFRVVRYDRPGTGLSDREVPPRTQAAEMSLLAKLAEALGDAEFSLFAVSCAAPVALTYAAGHQNRIRRLCLYGSYASGADIATPQLWDALADVVMAHWGVGSDALTARLLPEASPEDFEAFSRNQRDWASAPKAAELLRLSSATSAKGWRCSPTSPTPAVPSAATTWRACCGPRRTSRRCAVGCGARCTKSASPLRPM